MVTTMKPSPSKDRSHLAQSLCSISWLDETMIFAPSALSLGTDKLTRKALLLHGGNPTSVLTAGKGPRVEERAEI